VNELVLVNNRKPGLDGQERMAKGKGSHMVKAGESLLHYPCTPAIAAIAKL